MIIRFSHVMPLKACSEKMKERKDMPASQLTVDFAVYQRTVQLLYASRGKPKRFMSIRAFIDKISFHKCVKEKKKKD